MSSLTLFGKRSCTPFRKGRWLASMAALALLALGPAAAPAADGTLTVQVDQPGVKISPTLYGLMTEEINHSYDGGLYGELIQNRSFLDMPFSRGGRGRGRPALDPTKPPHWSLVTVEGAAGSMTLDENDPLNAAQKNSLRLDVTSAGADKRVGAANEGYWGIPVRPNNTYTASFYAKAKAGFTGPLTVDIESNDGKTVFATATSEPITGAWKKYTMTLKTADVPASATNRFVVSATTPGTVWLSFVSLFPPTYLDRPSGNRIDLSEVLAGMAPSFLRFPGGNYVEGNDFANRFNWKQTIGPVEERPTHLSPWNYRSTDGMGLLEFLLWCQDLKMDPVLAVYAGLHLDGGRDVRTGDALKPFVEEALEEIEYVTGDTSTKWGAQRAKDGHAAPFKLTYVEIGNEDFLNQGTRTYDGRFAMFYDAIKAKYPQLQIIATTPVRSRTPDLIDEHYYQSPAWMYNNTHKYDSYNRSGPKVFVGEWATKVGSAPTPSLQLALSDAAWMTGMERNSDIVVMACYAPLLVNVSRAQPQEASQWTVNLIGYDALNSFGSPSYYAQAMFGQNKGDTVLPATITRTNAPSVADAPPNHGAIGVGTWATNAEYKDIKVAQGDKVLYQSDFSKDTGGTRTTAGMWAAVDGALRQTSNATDTRATVGDTDWTDYTLTMKARKISGSEGFLILFHYQNNDNFTWWNIGGWGNTRTALERTDHGAKAEFGQSADSHIDNDKWYDLRVELKGRNVKGFIDDKLVIDAMDEPMPPPSPLYAAASRVDATGEVIVKVVNSQGTAQTLELNIAGVKDVDPNATVETLSGQPADVNTITDPMKVAPKKTALNDGAAKFTHEFPAYSVTVIRMKAK